MEQQLNHSSTAKDAWHRIVRLVFYVLSSIAGGLGLFLVASLSIFKISCELYYSIEFQTAEKFFPFTALAVLPFFIYHVVISANKKQWWHLGISIFILVMLVLGLYFFLASSMFYCFLDSIPDEFFYWGPH